MTSNDIVDKYLGVNYVDGGRDPNIGLDCWGLLLCVTKDLFGVEFPDMRYKRFGTLRNYVKSGRSKQPVFTLEGKDIVSEYNLSDWVHLVDDVKLGDIVLLCPIKNLAIHAGIYLQAGKFIHSVSDGGVVLGNVVNSKHQIEGYYRLKEEVTTKVT